RTSDLVPLCHPLALTRVAVVFEILSEQPAVLCTATVETVGPTGVEMEALTGVVGALLCIYDLAKAVNPALTMSDIRLRTKEGGKSGYWEHPGYPGDERAVRAAVSGPKLKSTDLRGIKTAVLTVSDRAAAGTISDVSGALIKEFLAAAGAEIAAYAIVADEEKQIEKSIRSIIDDGVVLLMISGGTGLSPRDVTPEAVSAAVDRVVPGISELLRVRGAERTPYAALSRAVCGLLGRSLVISLPGSPRAVAEGLDLLRAVLPHALRMAAGEGHE
ncbi:MAG TPA: molybdopterin-binding protein, partial [Oligoflexia bacterium]|nr:molybdopterin-binding protein [Oligoflexia bacterium]